MTAIIQTSNYNKGLQNCLIKHLRILEYNIHSSRDAVFNHSINQKIRFVMWIIKILKSNKNICYDLLIIMIETEIIILKRRLDDAIIERQGVKLFDSLQHLERLRKIVTRTHRKGFNDILFY